MDRYANTQKFAWNPQPTAAEVEQLRVEFERIPSISTARRMAFFKQHFVLGSYVDARMYEQACNEDFRRIRRCLEVNDRGHLVGKWRKDLKNRFLKEGFVPEMRSLMCGALDPGLKFLE